MGKRRNRNARRREKKQHRAAGALLLLAVGGLLWFWFFFKIQDVEVAGSTHYSKKQIKDIVLTGPLAENSVLAPLLCSRENTGEISFIDAVEVSYVNPNEVLITVKEKQSIGCVRYLDCYVYFDREGTVIESSVKKEDGILYFEGLTPDFVCLNQPLSVGGEDFLEAAASLSQLIEAGSRQPDNIRFDEKSVITLMYGEIQVRLGKNQYLDDKMARMEAILPQIEGQKGTLHLENITSEKKNITFENDGGAVRKK